jgi:hypothetical protein
MIMRKRTILSSLSPDRPPQWLPTERHLSGLIADGESAWCAWQRTPHEREGRGVADHRGPADLLQSETPPDAAGGSPRMTMKADGR